MANYSCTGTLAVTTSLGIVGATTPGQGPQRRIFVYDFIVGNDTTPADGVTRYSFKRTGGSGTYTTTTPAPLDPADAAAVTIGQQTFTADPTPFGYNSVLMEFTLNQRATFRWVAAPGSELRCAAFPATAMYISQVQGSAGAPPIGNRGMIFFSE